MYIPFFNPKTPVKDFSVLKYIPQLGDAILIHNAAPNFVADGIEWFSGGHVSHVAMYVGGGEGAVIDYGIRGCTKHALADYFKNTNTIYVRRIVGITLDQAVLMKQAAYNDLAKNKPYDFISYLGYLYMGIRYRLGDKYIYLKDNPIQGSGKVCSSGYRKWGVSAGIDICPEIGDESDTPEHVLTSTRMITLSAV